MDGCLPSPTRERLLRWLDRLRVADFEPLARERRAVESTLSDRAFPQLHGAERSLRRIAQQPVRYDLNSHIDERRDAPRLAARQPTNPVHVEIAGAAEVGRARVRND